MGPCAGELQLKCTARDVLDGEQIRFALGCKNYDDLRGEDFLVPRILVVVLVVLVPPNPSDWLRQSDEELAMRHCGYWVSLRSCPAVSNQQTVTVYIPRAQQLTPAALQQMLQRVSDRGAP